LAPEVGVVLTHASTHLPGGSDQLEDIALRALSRIPIKSPDNPILTVGASGEWDDTKVIDPHLCKEGDTYYLFYTGYDGTNWRIGVATGTSLENLTKYTNNPILDIGSPGDWDDTGVFNPSLLKYGGKYYLFFGGWKEGIKKIGVAEADSILGPYTKFPDNPILDVGASGEWDSADVASPHVIQEGGIFYLFYNGQQAGVTGWPLGYATASSPTGPYTRYANNPVFSGTDEDWDVLMEVYSVIKFGSRYIDVYETLGGDNIWRLAIAFSDDRVNWVGRRTPIMDVGPSGAWDNYYVLHPDLLLDWDKKRWVIVYSAWPDSGGENKIGFAELPLYGDIPPRITPITIVRARSDAAITITSTTWVNTADWLLLANLDDWRRKFGKIYGKLFCRMGNDTAGATTSFRIYNVTDATQVGDIVEVTSTTPVEVESDWFEITGTGIKLFRGEAKVTAGTGDIHVGSSFFIVGLTEGVL